MTANQPTSNLRIHPRVAVPGSIVVFFDGHCGLCSHTVDFLIARDERRLLRYSPLQGETAARQLTPQQRQNLDSIAVSVAIDGSPPAREVILERSQAVSFCLNALGAEYALLGCLIDFVPLAIANRAYDWVARNRFSLWFRIFGGKRESCRIPTAEERPLFLP